MIPNVSIMELTANACFVTKVIFWIRPLLSADWQHRLLPIATIIWLMDSASIAILVTIHLNLPVWRLKTRFPTVYTIKTRWDVVFVIIGIPCLQISSLAPEILRSKNVFFRLISIVKNVKPDITWTTTTILRKSSSKLKAKKFTISYLTSTRSTLPTLFPILVRKSFMITVIKSLMLINVQIVKTTTIWLKN